MTGRHPQSRSERNENESERVGTRLGMGIGRKRPGPDRRAVYGSMTFHAILVVALLVSGAVFAHDLPEFEVYRVQLISPPPQVAGEPEPVKPTAAVVQRPEPQKVVEVAKPTPQPKRPVERKPVEEAKPKDPEPTKGANPDARSPGGDNVNIDIQGEEFPFPGYLDNIVLQLTRGLRWDGNPNLSGEVVFAIERDGSITKNSLQVVTKSGNWNFDIKMIDATEAAGKRGAFGPLPDGWLQDKLWVRFRFLPPR